MKDKLIEQLMATGVFGEDDKEYLTGLEEDKLQAKLDALAAKAEPKVDDEGGDDKDSTPEPEAKHLEADPVANEAEPEGEPEVDRPKTAEEYLASSDMPDEFKEVLDSGLKMHREKKARLVKELSSNKRCKFTKDQLEAKGIEELEALAELANVPVDYTANSGKTKTPPTEPKANERQEDGTGVPEMPHEQWTADGRPDFSHLQ